MFNRLVVIILLFAACVLHADDDHVLLWFFNDPEIVDVDGSKIEGGAGGIVGRGDAAGQTVNAVRISMSDTSGDKVYLNLTDVQFDAQNRSDWASWVGLPAQIEKGDAWLGGPGYADLAGLSLSSTGVTFMMELGHITTSGTDVVDWTILASSEGSTLGELIAGGHVVSAELAYQGGFNWQGTGYAVPEPSSGLLMLVGGALLALRRRRKGAKA